MTQLLAISGSLRLQSSNTDLLRAVALLAAPRIEVVLEPGLAALPPFNPDLDGAGAVLPEPVRSFRARVGRADGLLISSPEYAHGVPGSLKNALDWLVSGPEIIYKPVGLLNPSPRSTHAHASLAETLRTMSVVLVEGAVLTLPISGRPLAPADIAADPDLSASLRLALDAIVAAVPPYRERRPSMPEVRSDARLSEDSREIGRIP